MSEDDDREAALRGRIREGMEVLGMDGDTLGRVFDVGEHAIALERGAFFPHEWTAAFTEVERVDEHGVWLKNGRGSLERVSDAFCGPIEPYRAAADASPIHEGSSAFRPQAVAHGEAGAGPEGSPAGPPAESAQTSGGEAPHRR